MSYSIILDKYEDKYNTHKLYLGHNPNWISYPNACYKNEKRFFLKFNSKNYTIEWLNLINNNFKYYTFNIIENLPE